jgi:phospholipid/cholesterol/gamma-HCH transport system substrate-binding protein
METRARYILVGLFAFVVAAAGFIFVYWLHNSAGAGRQALYRVRFEKPAIGLRSGVAVLFNGLRVGEVRRVEFDASDPKLLMALIAVDPATPMREDTHVGIDSQGLLGSIVVSLSGGASAAAPKSSPTGEPPILVADASASEGLSQAAKGTLNRIDAIPDDNADALRKGIGNLNTFSEALARNSGRVDSILAGLEKTMGGGPPTAPPRFYDLDVPQIPPADKPLMTQIAVAEVATLLDFDTQKALASPEPGVLQPLGPGQWSDSLPKLVQAKITQTFENAGFTRVAKPTEGFAADIQVLLDIQSFELRFSPDVSAHVEISVKLLGADGKIRGARTFQASASAAGADAPAAFAALNQAFGKVAYDLVVWVEQMV